MFVCVCVLRGSSTSDLGLGAVLGSRREEQLSVFASRQRSILNAVVLHLSLAVLPLKSDALIRQLHCLQVSGGIQIYNKTWPLDSLDLTLTCI